MSAELSMGPVLFNWKPEFWRDFYFEVADESPVTDVYIGEAVCSKRQPFTEPFLPDVIERLEKAKKKVILSGLGLIMNRRESNAAKDLCAQDDYRVEANDISAHSLLMKKPHVIGPAINVYNEDTLEKLAKENAVRFCLPQELPAEAIKILAQRAKKLKVETEIQVFGRVPLAISARCYHSRAHHLPKDNCQFVCDKDPDGRTLKTLDGKDFLTINGVQTMSCTYLDLLQETKPLLKMGVNFFRLSPHTQNMTAVAKIFHDVLKGKKEAKDGQKALKKLLPGVSFSNGFYHGVPGHEWQAA